MSNHLTLEGVVQTLDSPRVRILVLGIVLAIAFASRGWMAISTPLLYDEYQWAALADSVSLRPGEVNLPLHGDQHPPGQVYWSVAGVAVFGPNLVGYRAASVVLGTLAVAAIYFLGLHLGGPVVGLLAAFLLATNEYHIGISRLCTEKNYLTFAILGALFFERALSHPSTRAWTAAGVSTGLGIATKQALGLWVPLFGLEAMRRRGVGPAWRQRGIWAALGIVAAFAIPDLYWNLISGSASPDPGDLGIAYQLSRLELGSWSWGPLALYIRPLYFNGVEPAISEYASMTTLAGGILLGGAVVSLFTCRSATARFLQILGFTTFFFFSLFTRPSGEFWWADLSVPVFITLTARALTRHPGRGGFAVLIVAAVMIASAGRLVQVRDNYFPIEWGSPPSQIIEAFRATQRQLVVSQRGRDHARLCSVGTIRLPACSVYEEHLAAYAAFLSLAEDGLVEPESLGTGWPPVPSVNLSAERTWVTAQLAAFSSNGS